MKVLKKIPAHVKEKTVVLNFVCDICKEDYLNRTGFKHNIIDVKATIGSVYPECDTRTFYIVDVCEDCFLDKVIPLFKREFGTDFRVMPNDEVHERTEDCYQTYYI